MAGDRPGQLANSNC